jgi:hypothetical protein
MDLRTDKIKHHTTQQERERIVPLLDHLEHHLDHGCAGAVVLVRRHHHLHTPICPHAHTTTRPHAHTPTRPHTHPRSVTCSQPQTQSHIPRPSHGGHPEKGGCAKQKRYLCHEAPRVTAHRPFDCFLCRVRSRLPQPRLAVRMSCLLQCPLCYSADDTIRQNKHRKSTTQVNCAPQQ